MVQPALSKDRRNGRCSRLLAGGMLVCFLVFVILSSSSPAHDNLRMSITGKHHVGSMMPVPAAPPCSPSSSSSSSSSSLLLRRTLLENADRKIAERRAWLSDAHSEGQQFGNLNGASLWYMFAPVLSCFWDFEKTPSAAVVHDGGKWLCGLAEVHSSRRLVSSAAMTDNNNNNKTGGIMTIHHPYYQSPCIVYSMGSSNQFDFEERVRTVAPGCEIHTFDPTARETGKGRPFYNVYHGDFGFGGQDQERSVQGRFPVKSLPTILRELHHDHVDYLKIDVEGFEWDFLRKVDWSGLKVGQILIEFHPQKMSGPKTAKSMNEVFVKLETAGFYLISLEPVTYTNFGQVELVFLHKDWQPNGNW